MGKGGLKGQKMLAQGSTLGNRNRQVFGTPSKGKSSIEFLFLTMNCQELTMNFQELGTMLLASGCRNNLIPNLRIRELFFQHELPAIDHEFL